MMQIKALANFNRDKNEETGKVYPKWIPVTITVAQLKEPKEAKAVVIETLNTAGLKDYDIHERIEIQYIMEV